MSELKSLSPHRALPFEVQRMIEAGAWGDLLRAFDGGLSVNLAFDGDQTLFGSVTYTLAESGPQGSTHAAWGPLSVVESFISRGLNHFLHPGVSAIVDVVAAGQWPWVPALIDADYPIEAPEGRSVFHAMVEGRMARRMRGREEQWEDMELGVRFFSFNEDTIAEAHDMELVARLLVDNGADIEAEESDEDEHEAISALTLAVMYGDLAMVKALLLAGAVVHFDPGGDLVGMNSLHPLVVAAKEGVPAILDILMEHSGLDVMAHHGVDAMHVAASYGHIECMEVLCGHGLDSNAPTRQGQCFPLHQAALHGRDRAIDWLLSRGASWDMGGDFSAASVLCTHQPAMARAYKLVHVQDNVVPLRPPRKRPAN